MTFCFGRVFISERGGETRVRVGEESRKGLFIIKKNEDENPFESRFLYGVFPLLSVARTSQTFFIPPISVSLLLNLLLYVSSYFGFKKLQEIKITTFLTLQLKKCAKENKQSASNIAHMEKVETMWVIALHGALRSSMLRSLCLLCVTLRFSFEKLLSESVFEKGEKLSSVVSINDVSEKEWTVWMSIDYPLKETAAWKSTAKKKRVWQMRDRVGSKICHVWLTSLLNKPCEIEKNNERKRRVFISVCLRKFSSFRNQTFPGEAFFIWLTSLWLTTFSFLIFFFLSSCHPANLSIAAWRAQPSSQSLWQLIGFLK